MEANKILTADLLDLLFDERNKAYGAYELRRSYNKRIQLALLVTAGLILGAFAASYLSRALQPPVPVSEKREVTLTSIDQTPKEKAPEPPPPPPPPVQKTIPQVKMEQFTPPQIVRDEDVNEKDIPPEVDQLDDAKIGLVKMEGIADDNQAAPTVVDQKAVVMAPPVTKEEDEGIVTHVEIEAEFPGGTSAWTRFLQKNLNPDVPVDNGAPEGSFTVIIQFIVDKQGAVSDIRALTHHGYGMEEEAIRVMKKAARWTPAIQNGRNVNAYRKQPITFVVAAP